MDCQVRFDAHFVTSLMYLPDFGHGGESIKGAISDFFWWFFFYSFLAWTNKLEDT